MKIEAQVCSLEFAKKLMELGVKQESLFSWANTIGQKDQRCWRIEPKIEDAMMGYLSAFTVAELGEMLPPAFSTSRGVGNRWICVDEMKSHSEDGKLRFTETEARAKMLIYLIENKLITLEA
jgi:hypothetical protein